MSPARKLALRLKCPRQVQQRVRGCSWWSQPSAQGQAQWVSQQMEILCAVNRCSTAFHLIPSSPEHSLLPLSLSYKKAVFVVRPSANSPGQWQRLMDTAGLVHLNTHTPCWENGSPTLKQVCVPRRFWVAVQ